MVCTYCGYDTNVSNSRHQRRSNTVWRRRKCQACGAVFSTIERADYEKSWIVEQPNGTLAPFLRDKLFVSVYNSCRHRPTALSDSIALTNTIISVAQKGIENGTLSVRVLASIVLTVLKRFDEPAAVSYRAFHSDVL